MADATPPWSSGGKRSSHLSNERNLAQFIALVKYRSRYSAQAESEQSERQPRLEKISVAIFFQDASARVTRKTLLPAFVGPV
jgi:hypothetical protein